MTPEQWNRLMRQAHTHAVLHGHRVGIRAVELSPRSARTIGTRWAYAIDCPALARDLMPGH